MGQDNRVDPGTSIGIDGVDVVSPSELGLETGIAA